MPDEILRDRLLFGICDKVRERLLRETGLTLQKTDDICRASESMQKQIKVVESNTGVPVIFYSSGKGRKETSPKKGKFKGNHVRPKECGNCGKQHDVSIKKCAPPTKRNAGSAENYRILPTNVAVVNVIEKRYQSCQQ